MGEVLQGELLEKVLELKKIKNLRRTGKLTEAKEEILKYLEKYPEDYYGLFTAGRIFASLCYYDQAKEFLLKVANSDSPNRFSAYSTLGEISKKEGNKQQAITYYKKAIYDNPNIETRAIIALTDILINDKKFEDAYKLISLIKKTSPDYYNVAVAEIYSSKKLFTEAKKYIDKVSLTRFTPFDRKVYLKKIIINKHLQNYNEAFFYLAKLSNINDVFYKRGLIEAADIYFQLRDYDKAYKTCLKCEQDNPKVNYLLGRLNEKWSDIEEAKKYYQIASNATSNSITRDSLHRLGDISCEERDFSKALNYYKLAITKFEVFPRNIYFKIVGILIKINSFEQAYNYLVEMKRIYPDIENDSLYKVTETYLCKMLGKEISTTDLSFKEKMIISYSYPKVIEHIRDYESAGRAKFSHPSSIEDIYLYAQNSLLKRNKQETKVLDTYDIYMPDIGYMNGKFTSKLRIITIPHTNLILDMYPSFERTLKDKMNKRNFQYQNKK